MLKYGNKEFRSLEEQVQKNKEDIANHYNIDRVLADFGIRVIGQVQTKTELPPYGQFKGTYGDAYAVGVEPPYSFYIWTRADVNAGQDTDYWLDIGELAIVGPQGPQGPVGPEGPQGKEGIGWRVFTSPDDINPTFTAPIGTIALNVANGAIWNRVKLSTGSGISEVWFRIGNLTGPQGETGPQGPRGSTGAPGPRGQQGPKGDPSGIVAVRGILPNVDQLPSPVSLNDTTAAYLIGEAAPYDLYIQVGPNPATAKWLNTGPINAGTLVYVDGIGQNTWNSNSKRDIITGTDPAKLAVYTKAHREDRYDYAALDPEPRTIAFRSPAGNVRTGIPADNNDCVPYQWFAAKLEEELTPTYAHNITIRVPNGTAAVSGETVTGCWLKTTVYNNTDTPLTFDQVYHGTDTFNNLISSSFWIGEFNRESYTSGNKLCKVIGWRRGSNATGNRLSIVGFRWANPTDMFILTFLQEDLQITDEVFSYDTYSPEA